VATRNPGEEGWEAIVNSVFVSAILTLGSWERTSPFFQHYEVVTLGPPQVRVTTNDHLDFKLIRAFNTQGNRTRFGHLYTATVILVFVFVFGAYPTDSLDLAPSGS